MPITNPFSITYGGREVGGATAYQLTSPYVLEKTHDTLSLSFDVLVVGTSFEDFHSQCDALETDFRSRLDYGDTLVIDLSGTEWTYTEGETILQTSARIAKGGNAETDRGYARTYTVTIEGQLPPADSAQNGLRDVSVTVLYDSARRRTVSMRGTYVAFDGDSALSLYQANFDAEAAVYLTAIGGGLGATFELVDEVHDLDRHKDGDDLPFSHVLNFERQYLEQIFDQSAGQLDDPDIRDHRVTFSELASHPGDGGAGVFRLRRVIATYDCAVDRSRTLDVVATYRSKVLDHIRGTFIDNFSPGVFCVEDSRVSYDKTSNRISASVQYLYQDPNGGSLIEVTQSVGYRENRTLDLTPVHEQSEVSYEVDAGWTSVQRVTTRVAVALGSLAPRTVIVPRASAGGSSAAGGASGLGGSAFSGFLPTSGFQPEADLLTSIFFGLTGGGLSGGGGSGSAGIGGVDASVKQQGWNVVAFDSSVESKWIGDPSDSQIQVTTQTEVLVETYSERPSGSIGGPITPGGFT